MLGREAIGMPAIALLNDEKELLGFMLVATDEPFAASQQYDCVFTGVPGDKDLLDTPLCNVIQEHKNTEFVLYVSDDTKVFNVDLCDGWSLSLSIADEGYGSWSVKHISGADLSGKCILVKKGSG